MESHLLGTWRNQLAHALDECSPEYQRCTAAASSTTYWINGRSTKVSISFGIAFVAGNILVPSPATGITAFVTCFDILNSYLLFPDELVMLHTKIAKRIKQYAAHYYLITLTEIKPCDC